MIFEIVSVREEWKGMEEISLSVPFTVDKTVKGFVKKASMKKIASFLDSKGFLDKETSNFFISDGNGILFNVCYFGSDDFQNIDINEYQCFEGCEKYYNTNLYFYLNKGKVITESYETSIDLC